MKNITKVLIATIILISVVTLGFTTIYDDEAEASNVEDSPIIKNIVVNDSKEFDIMMTGPSLQDSSLNVSSKWELFGTNTGVTLDNSTTNTYKFQHASYSVTCTVIDIYHTHVAIDMSSHNDDVVLNIKYVVTSTSTIDSQKSFVQTLHYTLKITKDKTDSSITPTIVKPSSGTLVSGNTITLPEGEVCEVKLTPTNHTEIKYKWYAQNLPKGLTMNSSGVISGIPEVIKEQDVNPGVTVKLDIFSKDGSHFTSELIIKLTKQGSVTYKITSNNVTDLGKVNNSTVYGNDDVEKYMMYSGNTLTFDLVGPDGYNIVVKGIDASGAYTTLAPSTHTYTMKPIGAGEYLVTATLSKDGKSQESVVFALMVVNEIKEVNAGISFDLDVSKS